ncbi:MAG: efflux RND transporter periplasmic adaptor subunit [Oryzomonas sp.]|uniref:efflux RND transporter periplasmic adaptor subunit n=1 Tax=Oryzomonas sp. TaxID=2855186 RepID=UPI002848A1CE|nr:efflux RND transporter periplasmic adaptor subunit [Oryzomonas sp.]MDR3581224.1 efflux RND transporter periplasmic adaptor subunit [Oryzomonas sp.]
MTMFSRKRIIITLSILLAFVGAGLLVRHFFFAKAKVTYVTASAARMDIEESVLASGILKGFKTVAVGAQVSGQLKKLHVALGDKVKKGQLLAEIDSVTQVNALKDSEAQVENLRAQKRSKQALLKEYDLAYQRQRRMMAGDAASQADLESAQASLDGTRHDIASLDAQIKSAVIAVDTAKANLGYTQISAPMDGSVISIDTDEGQTVVSTQTATTIITLATLDNITVKAKISEADVVRVKPGLTTYFTLLGDADTRYYSKLRAIEPGPVSTTSTSSTSSSGSSSSSSTSTSTSSSAVYYYGLFEVPNPDNRLRVSMTAQVTIVLNEAKHALCIPSSALDDRQKGGRYTVRVLRNNVPETRIIRVGINNSVYAQVLEGLREGDKVVVGDSTSVPETATTARHPGPPPGGRH